MLLLCGTWTKCRGRRGNSTVNIGDTGMRVKTPYSFLTSSFLFSPSNPFTHTRARASEVQSHTYIHFFFPSLFIPIFSLFCGFEIPIRLILLTKFPLYSLNIKIASRI